MSTTSYSTAQVKRKTWEQHQLSTALLSLGSAIGAKLANIRCSGAQVDEKSININGGADQLANVTQIPLGRATLVVQYVRNQSDSQLASHMDILSMESLSADVLAIEVGATEDVYDIGVRASSDTLAHSTLLTVVEQLKLEVVST